MRIKRQIKKKLKSFVIKHENINYIYLCFKNFENINFFEMVNNKQNYIEMKQYGNKNLYKNFYLIRINFRNMGLGAYFRWSLHALYECDILKFAPVIEFGEKCIYKENNNYLNTNNVFEYYFKQSICISLKEVYQSNRVFLFKKEHLYNIDKNLGILKNNDDLIVGYNNITENYLKRMGFIVQKYIFLNDISKNFIENSINLIFPKNWEKKKILAVHVRGTDFALHWDHHPNIVEADDFFTEIDKAIKEYGFEYIFLATDDSIKLEIFKEKYKEKLLYFKDVHRSSGKVNVSFEKINRENNNYLNGLEVLRDMYTMAYCNGFIAGLSQVSISTRIINRSLEKRFEYEKIIDKGIYKA